MLVVCSLTRLPVPGPFASSVMLRVKGVMPKPLLEEEAPWSSPDEGPRSLRKCFWIKWPSFSRHSGVGEAGGKHLLGPGPPEAFLIASSLTQWPVRWLIASSVMLGLKMSMPKPLLEADASWGVALEGPGS